MSAMMKTSRFATVITALVLAFSLSYDVQAEPETTVYANALDLPEVARSVPMDGALRVYEVSLDQFGMTDLELKRFAVFAPDATIEVVGGFPAAVPDVAYFRGQMTDDPNSLVLLAVPADVKSKGKGTKGVAKLGAHGVIFNDSGSWLMERDLTKSGLLTRKVDLDSELAGRTFDCGVDLMTASQLAEGMLNNSPEPSSTDLDLIPHPLNILYTGHVILDTDYEYWNQFWSIYQPDVQETAAAALAYLGDLIAYASVAYERDLNTNLVISYARLFATNSDPYELNSNACGCDGEGKLDEVQDVWSGNSTPRTIVHFVSGKSEGCGCAYVGVLCSQGDGYGASSSIGTGFNIDSPGYIWEGMVIAHEIGHNFGTGHTHDYCGEFGIDDPVDICVSDNCLSATPDLPGLDSLTGGTAGAQNGTIMSYCHQRSGGYSNIAHTFGLYTPYGKAPWRVPAKMLGHIQASTGCMGVQYTGSGLRVTKDCKPDDPMQVGDTATCTITVENLGPDIAQGVVAVDDYLSNGTFTFGNVTVTKGSTPMPADTCTTTPNPQVGSGKVTCDIDLLDAGHTAIIKIEVTASRPQNINDRVVVTSDSPDDDPSDNVATDEVNVVEYADLSVTKVCKPDGPQAAGGTATCEIVVTNNGPARARDVMLDDTLTSAGPFPYTISSVTTTKGSCTPSGTTNVYSSPFHIACDIGTMWAGSTATVKVNLTSDEQIDINNVAAAASTATDPDVPTFDPDINNNTAMDGVRFVAQADLGITKTDDGDPVIAGGAVFHYDITVNNNGPSEAINVVVTDQVPAGLTILDITAPGGTCNTGVAGATPTTCTFDSLADGGSAEMHITVQALPDTRGLVTNDASVSSATPDPDNSNNLATEGTTVNAEADIVVAKTRTSAEVVAGAEVDYQVTVTNDGPSTATNVTLVDLLDSWMTFVSSSPACVENPTGTLTCALGTLQPSESAVVYITAKLDPATPDGTGIDNIATGSADEPDPNLGNNTASAPDSVTTRADLWIDKVQNDQTGNPSGALIYTLTVHNRPGCEVDDQLTCWNESGGPSDAQNVVITDPLPWTAKKLVVQYVSTGCTYDEGTHTVTCNAGTVAYDQSATFQIQMATKGSLGTETNTASVSSTTADPVSVNDTDTVTTTVKGGT